MNADLKKSERADAHLSTPELRVLLFEDESQDGFDLSCRPFGKLPALPIGAYGARRRRRFLD